MRLLAGKATAWIGLALVLLLTVTSGCQCGDKTDEEILKERIDCTAVHLYLAAKIAIVKADQSPEAKAARDQLMKVLKAIEGSSSTAGAGGGAPTRKMSGTDVFELAKALYHLRAEGEELLESGDEKGLKPFLPILLDAPPELAKVLDLNMEHALLLGTMFILKFHPKAPTPIPDELMLYEAWMTDTKKLIPGLRGLMPSIKATVYGNNELCDLAAKEAEIAEQERGELAKIAEMISVIAGEKTTFEAEQAKQVDAAVRAIAHGVSANCYLGREENEKAIDELDQFVDAAGELGIPETELALIRGYIALEKGDHAAAKTHLETARDNPNVSAETKENLQEVIDNLEGEDSGIIEEKLGKGFFALNSTRIVVRHLDNAGVFEALKDTEVARTLTGFASAAGSAGGKAKEFASGDGWIDKLKERVFGD
jgi:hypothetical protein